VGAETISAKMAAAVGAIPWIQRLMQEETKTPSQETESTPCADNICEECPKFESGTCDIVKSDEE
jgi:hypothetical protein